jgi:hypothetical protein
VLGSGKSGTSGLYLCLKQSAETYFRKPFDAVFEPHSTEEALEARASLSICKILLERFVKFEGRERVLRHFQKRVAIIRDPRDNVISRLMWNISMRIGRADKKGAETLLAALRQKEADPDSVSVYRLYEIAAPVVGGFKTMPGKSYDNWSYTDAARKLAYSPVTLLSGGWDGLVIKYEDFINRKFEALEAYLGFPVLAQFEMPKKTTRILRTAQYNNWVNWFLDEDYTYFVEPRRRELEMLGYEDWRPKGIKRVIAAEEATGYVDRVQRSLPKRKVTA